MQLIFFVPSYKSRFGSLTQVSAVEAPSGAEPDKVVLVPGKLPLVPDKVV